jgi:hypothetical protein
MPLEWFLAWYNLVFAVPFLLALAYLAAYVVSGVTFGDADADADSDSDVEADVDADVEADAEAEVEADSSYAPDTIAVSPRLRRRALARLNQAAPLGALLRFFGVGRVPLSVLLMVLFFAWGFLGVSANALLRDSPIGGAEPWQVSLPVALVGSALVGRGASGILARWLPTTETYAREKAALVGRPGEAVLRVDERFGLAAIRDARGNGHQVACRVYHGAPPIEKGRPLLVAGYDAAAKLYYVSGGDCLP